MPRPVQYSKEDMEALIQDKLERGIPVKANCMLKNWPYVSVNKALRRYGLSIPRKYAEVKARVAGQPQVVLAAPKPKKPRQSKKKAPMPVQGVVGGSQLPE
jgi:hypothetical protein